MISFFKKIVDMSIEWYCVSSNLKVKLFYKCKMKGKSLSLHRIYNMVVKIELPFISTVRKKTSRNKVLSYTLYSTSWNSPLKFGVHPSSDQPHQTRHVLHVHLHERAHVESEVFTLHSDERYLSYIYSTEYYTALHWCFKNVLDALYSFGIFSYIWLRNK